MNSDLIACFTRFLQLIVQMAFLQMSFTSYEFFVLKGKLARTNLMIDM